MLKDFKMLRGQMGKGGSIKVYIDTERGTISKTFEGKDEKDAQRKVDAYLNGPGKMWGKNVTVIPFKVKEEKKWGGEMKMGGLTKNEDLLESFLTNNKDVKIGNLSTHYYTQGDIILLRNYGTLIATRQGKTVKISTKKYSSTTSKITNKVEALAKSMGLNVEKISEVQFKKGGEMYGYGGEVEGTYGRSKNPATIFVYKQGRRSWYVVEGSVNVNCTYDDIEDGVDIEELNDDGVFTAPKPINSVEDLEMFMDDEEYAKGGSLKPIPKDNKGLPNLPKKVRNNMGYMKKGGKTKAPKRSAESIELDSNIKAKKPGKRISASGNVYYEYSPNRSDVNRKKKPYLKDGGVVGGGLESKKIEIYGFEYFLNIKDSNKFEYKGEDGVIASGSIKPNGFHVLKMNNFETVIALQDMIISLGEVDKDENYSLKTKNDYIHLTIDEGKVDKDGRQHIYYGDKLVATNNWSGGETLQKGTMDKNLAITVIYDIMDCCGNKMKEGGELKPIPKDNKGLPNLPEKVRNNMGYKEMGGTMEMGGEATESKWVYTIGGLNL